MPEHVHAQPLSWMSGIQNPDKQCKSLLHRSPLKHLPPNVPGAAVEVVLVLELELELELESVGSVTTLIGGIHIPM